MHTITIDGTRWGFGLEWQYLPNIDGVSPDAEARVHLRGSGASHGAITLVGDRHLVGIAKGKKPARKTYAAVIAAAKRPARTFIVAKLDDDTYWVCVAGAHRFDHRTEQVLDARRAVQQVDAILGQLAKSSSEDLPILVVNGAEALDTAWLHGAKVVEWVDVLGPQPPQDAALRAFAGRTPRERAVLVAGAVGILAAGGYISWQRHQAQREALEALALQEATTNAALIDNADAVRAAAQTAAVSAALGADTATPDARDLFDACVARVQGLGRYVGGWIVREGTCNATALTVAVAIQHPSEPTFGTASTLSQAVKAAKGAVAFDLANPLQASVTIPLPPLAVRSSLRSVVDLPVHGTIFRGWADTLLSAGRADAQLNLRIDAPVLRDITFADPTDLDAQGQPITKPVAPEQTYRITRIVQTAPYPNRLRLFDMSDPNVSLDRFAFVQTADALTTTIEIKVLTQ